MKLIFSLSRKKKESSPCLTTNPVVNKNKREFLRPVSMPLDAYSLDRSYATLTMHECVQKQAVKKGKFISTAANIARKEI